MFRARRLIRHPESLPINQRINPFSIIVSPRQPFPEAGIRVDSAVLLSGHADLVEVRAQVCGFLPLPPAGARSILDMLIQSWGDRIKVFPVVPDKWKNVSFANLRVEWAFLVTAVREGGKTRLISIQSEVGAPLRVETGIAGKMDISGVDAAVVNELGDSVVEIRLPGGATVVISDASYKSDFTVRPVEKKFSADWR